MVNIGNIIFWAIVIFFSEDLDADSDNSEYRVI